MLDNLVTWIIENGGLYILLLVVFAETGLFAGFFLPGDSLLFVAGIYAHQIDENTPGLSYEFLSLIGLGSVRNEWLDLAVLIGLISFAGIIGNTVGYWFGNKIGPTMYNWRDRLLFKQKYLHQAKEFYEKHGGIAIIGARFLPLVRTFAPIIAGIVRMDKKKFAFYNIVGSFAWVSSMVLGGHFLQKWVLTQFGFDLKSHLEVIVIVIVLVTTAPVAYKMFFSKKKSPTMEIAKDIPGEVLNNDSNPA
ncbi:MAG TPA: VTT domain-containing protein [Flavisolibacter sp.]|jgi:membrane-associated protein